MSATTTYQLPSPEELAWCDDLVVLATLRTEGIEEALRRPFDDDPHTEAEPVTLEYLGRISLLTGTLHQRGDELRELATKIEEAVRELRWSQEDFTEEGQVTIGPLGAETYLEHTRRQARELAVMAANSVETQAIAEDNTERDRGDAS